MQPQKVIEHLGYSPNEAKVYLSALHLGEAHSSDIAARAKLPRTTAQSILEKLRADGLVNFYVQRRYKYWVAENPERLLARVRKQEEEVRAVLPTLTELRKAKWGRPRDPSRYARDLGFFRILADGSDRPLLIADERVRIVHVNAAWEAQFGYRLEEVRGENPRILQSGSTPEAVYARMWDALSAGTLFQSDEIVDERKDGTQFTMRTTIFPLVREGRTYYVQLLDERGSRRPAEQVRRSLLDIAAQEEGAAPE